MFQITSTEVKFIREHTKKPIFIYRTFGGKYYVEETALVQKLLSKFCNELKVQSYGDSFYCNVRSKRTSGKIQSNKRKKEGVENG